MLGRRGSTDEGWTWSRPPRPPRRLPALVLLAVAGAGVIALLAVLGIVAFLVLDDGPAGGTPSTPTPTTTVAAATATAPATPTVTATPTATATAEPTPTATPLPTSTLTADGTTFNLTVWDGGRWQSEPPSSLRFAEGDAVPFLLRIEKADADSMYSLTLRHDCRGFEAISSYDREAGITPALAGPGPGSARPDSFVPTRGSDGGLSLWGGLFTAIDEPRPARACEDEGRLDVSLQALQPDVFLLWGAALSDGAGEADAPFRMTVAVAEAGELSLSLEPAAVGSGQ